MNTKMSLVKNQYSKIGGIQKSPCLLGQELYVDVARKYQEREPIQHVKIFTFNFIFNFY